MSNIALRDSCEERTLYFMYQNILYVIIGYKIHKRSHCRMINLRMSKLPESLGMDCLTPPEAARYSGRELLEMRRNCCGLVLRWCRQLRLYGMYKKECTYYWGAKPPGLRPACPSWPPNSWLNQARTFRLSVPKDVAMARRQRQRHARRWQRLRPRTPRRAWL